MFEVRKFFVRTDRTQGLSEQFGEPTCQSWPSRHLLRTLERFPRTAPLGVTWHIVIPIEENDHLTASEAATIAASASTHYSLLDTVGYKLNRKY